MKLRLKKLRLSNQLYLLIAATAAAIGLLLFRLGSLLPGLAAPETALPSVHDALSTVWNQPLWLPETLTQLLVAAILPSAGMTASRLPSVLLGLALVALLYWLLRQWYGYRLAIFGAVLCITAPWFLHLSRLATSDILYPLSMVVLLVLAALWHQAERKKWLVYATSIGVCLLLYIPGVIWLLPGLLLLERRNIAASIKTSKLHTGLAFLLGLITLTPLVHALIVDWRLYRPLLGIPDVLPSVATYAQQFVQVWGHIFVGGYHKPVYNLAGLPMINILMTLAFVVGVYLYGQHRKAIRTRQLAYWWLAGTAIVALGGPVARSLILPIVFVLAIGGLGYLLHLWLKVFPRNPLARAFGIGLVALVVAFAVAYNLRNYYVAWPHNQATRAAYTRQL